jgi:hypothetical protein
LPDKCRLEGRSPTPIFIKPSACGYMVAALSEELHSPFKERKPRRREDYKKRTRKSTTMVAALANTLHSLLGGRKPRRREACCEGRGQPEKGQELVNPASDRRDSITATQPGTKNSAMQEDARPHQASRIWLCGCRSCRRRPLALQGKDAPKKGRPKQESKEIRLKGSCSGGRPPLAL